MSVWTHVNATFRIDSFYKISDKDIISNFGKEIGYYDMDNELEYDDNFEVKNKEKYLPLGSEGTLHMNIWHNSNAGELASTTINVFGDLRDYDSFDDIMKWFGKSCRPYPIRQAICQVEVEGIGERIFIYNEENDCIDVIEVRND